MRDFTHILFYYNKETRKLLHRRNRRLVSTKEAKSDFLQPASIGMGTSSSIYGNLELRDFPSDADELCVTGIHF